MSSESTCSYRSDTQAAGRDLFPRALVGGWNLVIADLSPDLQRFARQELLNKSLEVNAGAAHISRILVGILIGVRKLEKDKQTALRVAKQALDSERFLHEH